MSYPRFTYRDFLGMDNPKEIIQWLNDKGANHLGYGASRQVYRISPKRVIKIEYEKYYGKSQNKHEVKRSDQFGETGMIARCFWYHPKYVWIISEFAEKIPESKRTKWHKWYDMNYKKIEKEMRICDMAVANTGIIGGRFVIVDAGLGWG